MMALPVVIRDMNDTSAILLQQYETPYTLHSHTQHIVAVCRMHEDAISYAVDCLLPWPLPYLRSTDTSGLCH